MQLTGCLVVIVAQIILPAFGILTNKADVLQENFLITKKLLTSGLLMAWNANMTQANVTFTAKQMPNKATFCWLTEITMKIYPAIDSGIMNNNPFWQILKNVLLLGAGIALIFMIIVIYSIVCHIYTHLHTLLKNVWTPGIIFGYQCQLVFYLWCSSLYA